MYITFTNVKIVGFMSIGSAFLDLQDLGLVAVEGRNLAEPLSKSNGSGKSTIAESIIWCLTGITSRGTSDVTNKFEDLGTEVTLNLIIDNISYTISRYKNDKVFKNKLIIIKDGIDISGDTLTKSKKVLELEIGKLSNSEILSSIIICTQGLNNRLSSLTPSNRKSRLEELGGLSDYLSSISNKVSSISKLINAEYSNYSMKNSNLLSLLENSKLRVIDYTEKLTELSTKEKEFSEEDLKNFSQSRDEIAKALSEASSELQVMNSKLSNYHVDQEKLNYQYSTLVTSNDQIISQIRSLGNHTCPMCNSSLTTESLSKVSETLYTEYYRIDSDLKMVIPSIDIITDSINQLLVLIDSKKLEIANLTSEYNQLNELLLINSSTNIHDYSYLEKLLEDESQNIENYSKELLDISERFSKFTEDKDIVSIIQYQLSRNFRNYLLSNLLEYMNNRLEFYSSYLFQSQGVIKLVSEGNNLDILLNDMQFENLSGGEGRRVDIALQLAQRDLAKFNSNFSSNLLILDEVLDNLDSIGIDSVLNLITDQSSDVSTLVIISHNDTVSVQYDTKIIVTKQVSKISNITIE